MFLEDPEFLVEILVFRVSVLSLDAISDQNYRARKEITGTDWFKRYYSVALLSWICKRMFFRGSIESSKKNPSEKFIKYRCQFESSVSGWIEKHYLANPRQQCHRVTPPERIGTGYFFSRPIVLVQKLRQVITQKH